MGFSRGRPGGLAGDEGADPEWFRTWEAGQELVALLDDPGADVDRQDIVDQIDECRALFQALVAERASP